MVDHLKGKDREEREALLKEERSGGEGGII